MITNIIPVKLDTPVAVGGMNCSMKFVIDPDDQSRDMYIHGLAEPDEIYEKELALVNSKHRSLLDVKDHHAGRRMYAFSYDVTKEYYDGPKKVDDFKLVNVIQRIMVHRFSMTDTGITILGSDYPEMFQNTKINDTKTLFILMYENDAGEGLQVTVIANDFTNDIEFRVKYIPHLTIYGKPSRKVVVGNSTRPYNRPKLMRAATFFIHPKHRIVANSHRDDGVRIEESIKDYLNGYVLHPADVVHITESLEPAFDLIENEPSAPIYMFGYDIDEMNKVRDLARENKRDRKSDTDDRRKPHRKASDNRR